MALKAKSGRAAARPDMDDEGVDFADAPAPSKRAQKPAKPRAGRAQPGEPAKKGRSGKPPGAEATAAPKRANRRRGGELESDPRPMLTVLVDGGDGEQFDLLVDGQAYWGGDEPPYRFEVRLDAGEHELRVRQRHAMNRRPADFMPLILAMLLGDGRRGEQGPYFAALDARVVVSADSRLTIKYSLTGRAGRENGRAAFKCSAGKGLECEVASTSMSTTPRLMRRWRFANGVALLAVTLAALSVVGLGAYLCVLPGGSLAGGLVAMALGTLMAMGCALAAGAVRAARDGGYAPDMDPPPKPRARKSRAAGGATEEGAPPGKARRSKPKRSDAPNGMDYDGAYDDANEMADFEEAGLATADLTPEQLREAKRQLLKKLGGEQDG